MISTVIESEIQPHLFSVQSIYQCDGPEFDQFRYAYEERIVLFRASSFEDAIAQAEHEAEGYGKRNATKPLDYFMAYQLDDEDLPGGIEVFSLIRDSNLEDREYLERHYDTGNERARSHDE